MTIRQYVSQLFGYRIKDGIGGWDDFTTNLEKTGTWSLTGSPRKFQSMIIEIMKRIERLEYERDVKPYEQPAAGGSSNPEPIQPTQ